MFDKEHKEVAAYLPPAQITGYEYEVEACARAIAQGEKECPEMPHDETVRVMEIMDGIRKSWGYEIPLYEEAGRELSYFAPVQTCFSDELFIVINTL